MDLYHELLELCEMTEEELKRANEKLRAEGGKISGGDISYIDMLTHTIKSIKTTMAMMDAEDDGYSRDNGMNGSGHYSGNYYGGRYYPHGSYSYAGRRNARRDSMGRYSRGYSRGDEEMVDQVRELMEKAPDEQTRRDFQKIIDRMEK